MTDPTHLRLTNLRMQNFRCFSECAISFHSSLTVLIADNGQGKTAIMDAVAIVLAQFVDQLTEARQSNGISATDIRLACREDGRVSPETPTRLNASGVINGNDVNWSVERRDFSKATSQSRAAKSLSPPIRTIKSQLEASRQDPETPLLPVVAYYPSIRFSQNAYFAPHPRRKPIRLADNFNGYRNFLDPLADSQHFNEWYEQQFMAVRNRAATGTTEEASPLLQLAAVRAAVDVVLGPTQWGAIDWDLTQRCVMAEHREHGRLPLAALSSGIRNMVALTADLAHRCSRLNPTLGEQAARRTPGVVLIDEVDLHLHPSWQQLVVELLRAAFPMIQFVLSTHSPQVLSTVHKDSIRVIKLRESRGHVAPPPSQTRGVESAEILAKVMGVDPVPKVKEASWLSDYRALVQNAQHESRLGKQLWHNLIEHFGIDHPVLSDIEVLRRLQAFRVENGLPLGKGG